MEGKVTKKMRSPLDFTERQVQNLLVLMGLGFTVFMLATRFPLDPLWAGLISMMLFGQKLIPWGSREYPSDPADPENLPVAKNPTGRTKSTRNNDSNVDNDRSHMRFSYQG